MTNLARYSGDLRSSAMHVIPSSYIRLLIAGVSIAWLVASLSFLTISLGAPFGRKKAFQVTTSKSVSPCSCAVGKSGISGERPRDIGARKIFDRTSLNLAIWLPWSEQAGGEPAIWPNSRPIPVPGVEHLGAGSSAYHRDTAEVPAMPALRAGFSPLFQ